MSKLTNLIFIFVTLLLSATAAPQEQFVVKIQGPNMSGSGVVVYKKGSKILIASALHVFRDHSTGPIILEKVFLAFDNNKKDLGKLQYGAANADLDVILMWADTNVDVPVAIIGNNDIITGVDVNYNTNNIMADFIGYGYGTKQKILGKVCFKDKGFITSDGICIPGQSGGGMFISNQLYGIISGGHNWHNEETMKIAWPIICTDTHVLKHMIEEAVADPPRDGPN